MYPLPGLCFRLLSCDVTGAVRGYPAFASGQWITKPAERRTNSLPCCTDSPDITPALTGPMSMRYGKPVLPAYAKPIVRRSLCAQHCPQEIRARPGRQAWGMLHQAHGRLRKKNPALLRPDPYGPRGKNSAGFLFSCIPVQVFQVEGIHQVIDTGQVPDPLFDAEHNYQVGRI